jgi:hypothetical protein
MEKCPRCKKFNPDKGERCGFCSLDFSKPYAPRSYWWLYVLAALFIIGLIWAMTLKP